MGSQLLAVAAVAMLLAGCSGADATSSEQPPPEPSTTYSTDMPTVAVETTEGRVTERPLSTIELHRIREVAARIERGLAIFDRRTQTCTDGNRARCLDTAWQGIVGDVLGSEFDLTAFRDLPAGCTSLDTAIDAILGFNLGARQIDYGPPGEVDTASRYGEQLALVETLRPIPSELRAAASAICGR